MRIADVEQIPDESTKILFELNRLVSINIGTEPISLDILGLCRNRFRARRVMKPLTAGLSSDGSTLTAFIRPGCDRDHSDA